MDLSETPLRPTAPRKRLRRKASNQSLPAPSSGAREIRSSKHFFTRAATIDLAYGTNASSSPSHTTNPSPGTSSQHTHHRPGFPLHSLPIDAVTFRPVFYRRRLDASTRNRIYVRDEAVDGPLSKNSQRLFRRVEKGAFGGLVLHSSMVGASVARMTNSVDVYCLH
ncbi:hypothetical protein BU24DRAFT_424542 [Aaosphaeria arxii CBS 175.79]|uniref:Uncharacterized protein n=1 Tax=Aaosphaeria arxii CBS 175.79 TaxID=1450172 RepID=A0A6A5XMI6_9PLEO|nr:uncharacterized protein BU24DRAFT_424542 [Aaosphaeria arxii CBS 175.79]KAF2013544.1 hypothetical protein BU24DRAFT_424542 [Aaosphaeria arxii CBS 175.79]